MVPQKNKLQWGDGKEKMPKPKFKLSKNLSKPKKPKRPSPRQVRENISILENKVTIMQTTPLPKNVILRNRQINWLENAKTKIRELYMMLYDLQEQGRVIIERERKRELAWKEFMAGCKKAGFCPEKKAKVDEECVECEHHVSTFTDKPTPDDLVTLTEEEIKEVIKSHDKPDTTLKVVLHPDRLKKLLKEKKIDE